MGIYRRLWYVSKDKEQDRDTNREVEVEWDSRKTIDISDSRLDYKVTIGSWKKCNHSSL